MNGFIASPLVRTSSTSLRSQWRHSTTKPSSPRPSLPRVRRCCPPSRTMPTMKFVTVSVPITIEAPRDFVFDLFQDLERMSEWSATLKSVHRDPDNENMSTWSFAWNGVRLSWQAKDTNRIEQENISWESTSGLVHTGCVDFVQAQNDTNQTLLTMTVDYDVASLLATLMQTPFVQSFVESAIKSDLTRFRKYVLQEQRKLKMNRRVAVDSGS